MEEGVAAAAAATALCAATRAASAAAGGGGGRGAGTARPADRFSQRPSWKLILLSHL